MLGHHDFWSGNVVWTGETLSGVVDWTGGCLGPPGFDTSWCRLDLYLLHGHAVADRFLAAYRLPMDLRTAGVLAAWSGDFAAAATLIEEVEAVCEATERRRGRPRRIPPGSNPPCGRCPN